MDIQEIKTERPRIPEGVIIRPSVALWPRSAPLRGASSPTYMKQPPSSSRHSSVYPALAGGLYRLNYELLNHFSALGSFQLFLHPCSLLSAGVRHYAHLFPGCVGLGRSGFSGVVLLKSFGRVRAYTYIITPCRSAPQDVYISHGSPSATSSRTFS